VCRSRRKDLSIPCGYCGAQQTASAKTFSKSGRACASGPAEAGASGRVYRRLAAGRWVYGRVGRGRMDRSPPPRTRPESGSRYGWLPLIETPLLRRVRAARSPHRSGWPPGNSAPHGRSGIGTGDAVAQPGRTASRHWPSTTRSFSLRKTQPLRNRCSGSGRRPPWTPVRAPASSALTAVAATPVGAMATGS
jgi:hypothetical protein